jgi:hypothetical protein
MTVSEIRKVKKFFQRWEERREVPSYQVVETFEDSIDTYDVINLLVDMENGIVYFYDEDDIILNKKRSVAKGFIASSAELVELSKDQFNIKLRDGTIKVKVA